MSDPRTEGPDPVALLSFPKCGRTWLKLMLKSYFEDVFDLGELPLDGHHQWHRIDPRVPKLAIEHDGDPHFHAAGELEPGRRRYASSRVVLLVRDPRDVMVSLFFEITKRTRFYEQWGFDTTRVLQNAEDLSTFLRGPVGRLDTLLAYYALWSRARADVGAFCLLRYEDMHEDPKGQLAKVLGFLGLEVRDGLVSRAVERCRFDRMRELEESNAFESLTLQAGDPDDPESFKVRRGKVGGYRDYMSRADVDWVDERCRSLPDLLACYRSAGDVT